jgi:hypothetical protein
MCSSSNQDRDPRQFWQCYLSLLKKVLTRGEGSAAERADDLPADRIRRLIGVDLDHIRPARQRVSQSPSVVTVYLQPASDRALGVIRSPSRRGPTPSS